MMKSILSIITFLMTSYCFAVEPMAKSVAEKIDQEKVNASEGKFALWQAAITSRIHSVAEFPIYSSIDAVKFGILSLKDRTQSYLTRDSNQRILFKNASKENADLCKKSLLATVTAPLSLISPDLVTHHYLATSSSPEFIYITGKLYQAKVKKINPSTIQEIQEILLEANRTKQKVAIIGSGMSQGKQFIPDDKLGILIETKNLNHISIDPKAKVATVGAGASWAELQQAANNYGLAVRVMQASNIFSIGGSLSVNCHGWDHKTGSVRNTVLEITVIDSLGNIHHLKPNDELFNYVIGGYGIVGVIVEAKLLLTDNIPLVQTGEEIPPHEYISYFENYIQNNPDIDMHLYRLSLEPGQLFRTGVAVNYIRYDDEPLSTPLLDEPERGRLIDRITLHTIRRLKWMRRFAWNFEKKQAENPVIASRNSHMRPPIKPIFNGSNYDAEWLQEYYISGPELLNFLHFLSQILNKNDVAVFNASVRFVKKDRDTILSYAPNHDQFAVVLFFNQKLSDDEIQKTSKWIKEVYDYLIAHEGTYYLPYQPFATSNQFHSCYPNWEMVLKKKKEIDPNETLVSGFYKNYFINKESDQPTLIKCCSQYPEDIHAFLKNIFKNLNSPKVFELIKHTEKVGLSNDELYNRLSSRISKATAKGISLIVRQIKALNAFQNEVGDQVLTLLTKDKQINGYVEIGYPGRMIKPLKKRLNLKGPMYVIADQSSLKDYIEAGFPLPYDKFISLNDYTPIEEIPENSVDLVCLYIGLHHIPENKIDTFLASIERIIRPGGSFILMDHDATSQKIIDLADSAHTLFNLGTGVSAQDNNQEIRNFQSIDYWTALIEKHGFKRGLEKPLVRIGDPTLNSLVRFDKPTDFITEPAFTNRPQIRTFLTAPEWQNVHSAQAFASFIQDSSISEYPYFQDIANFWKVFGHSWSAARSYGSTYEVATSDCTLMNLFIGVSMTLEYGAKGLISLPFSILPKNQTKNATKMVQIDSASNYADFINHTPFYCYPYFRDIGRYWKSYGYNLTSTSFSQNIGNFFRGTLMSIEYGLKGIVSAPIRMIYTSEPYKEDETIDMLVYDPEGYLLNMDPRIEVLSIERSGITMIRIPRYKPFLEIIKKISIVNLNIENIAGQKFIQLDIKHELTPPLLPGARYLYATSIPVEPNKFFFSYEIPTENLAVTFQHIDQNNLEVVYLHDF